MLERFVSLVKRPGNVSVQRNHHLLAGPFRAVLVSVAVCSWEIVAEANHGDVAARNLALFLPQIALLLMLGLQFFPLFQQRMRRWVAVATVAMVPAVIVAIVYSGFRLGIGLCCCSHSFWYGPEYEGYYQGPADSCFRYGSKSPATPSAEVSACGLVLDNCYMTFVRKIAHFYGTANLLIPLTTVVFGVLSRRSHQIIGQRHCHNFLDKTRSQ